MSENTIDLDFGTTAQKQQDGEKLPVVLLALDQGKYDMARSLDELRALAEPVFPATAYLFSFAE